ncbi:MAG: D-glycerate dehydrogenase [Calditrichaeota bacterium]|nr:D-glycerate dehydrogenase [Calditrichota bacterium]RQW07050.1 MAG: D-glycerate dehydrogenase [Calditrichota bacterium]
MSQKKPYVYVSRRIPEAGLVLLRDSCEMEVYSGKEAVSRSELLQKVRNVDGLLCLLSEKIDRELLDSASRLKVVSNYAVGFDNIDVEYATQKRIAVTNTPGVLTDATADLTWALILSSARRVVEGDTMMRNKAYKGWSPLLLLGHELKGKTLGILGAGRIGQAVAERSRGWSMKILYYDRNENEYLNSNLFAKRCGLPELLSHSDVISVHLPLSSDTYHLIDRKSLKSMKKSAVLVNTARGPIVDEKALKTALAEKWIAAAGLDVFENEPTMTEDLEKLKNVVLTPHIGSATIQARDDMARIAARNLLAILEGKEPVSIVNPDVIRK